MLVAQFLTIAVVHLLVVMSPGPDFAIVTRNSLVYSRRVAVFTALGIALGISIHVAYSIAGIGLVISQSILLFNVIKYIGAAYLVYVGYKSLRTKPSALHQSGPVRPGLANLSAAAAVRMGFFTNVLNPKATLFFLALFTQVINPSTPKTVQVLYGVEMMVITFMWFASLSMVFSNQLIRRHVSRVHHRVEQVTGVVLIALGIKVALASQK